MEKYFVAVNYNLVFHGLTMIENLNIDLQKNINISYVSENLSPSSREFLNQFKNDIPVLNMPTNYLRPAVKSSAGNKVYFKFDKRFNC